MKVSAINLNITFPLLPDASIDVNINALKETLSKLEAEGIKVETIRVPNTVARANREMGPNELKFLEVSGKTRMRCPEGESDREAFAARILKERFGVSADSVAAESAPSYPIGDNSSEDDDDEDLI